MTAGEYNADQYRYDEAYVDFLDVASPAAGAAASVVVPGQFGYRVLAARASLSTSATVANRLVSIDVVNANSSTRWRNPAPSTIAASQTAIKIEWNAAWHVGAAVTNGPLMVPLLDVIVPPSWTIKFAVDLIDTTDQLAGLSLVVLKVPTGA